MFPVQVRLLYMFSAVPPPQRHQVQGEKKSGGEVPMAERAHDEIKMKIKHELTWL
ncbi:unnamed protein product [Merluccius merluccius]